VALRTVDFLQPKQAGQLQAFEAQTGAAIYLRSVDAFCLWTGFEDDAFVFLGRCSIAGVSNFKGMTVSDLLRIGDPRSSRFPLSEPKDEPGLFSELEGVGRRILENL